MATQRLGLRVLWVGLLAPWGLADRSPLAQIHPQVMTDSAPCPLVVPASQPETQPLRIAPDQVPLKNRLSCLSPADAVYRPDGCPLRVCRYPDTRAAPPQLPRP